MAMIATNLLNKAVFIFPVSKNAQATGMKTKMRKIRMEKAKKNIFPVIFPVISR
jgi:hypothetical protein